MRVVVFGSTGMVGRAVASKLGESAGIEVLTVTRDGQGVDVADDPDVRGFLGGADLAINCIGFLRSDSSYGTPAFQYVATMVNGAWPQRLAFQATQTGCRVIHVSTDAVFSPAAEAAGEGTTIGPQEAYGLSKALGEVEADHVLNLRVSVIGPAPDRPSSLWEWLVTRPGDSTVEGFASFGWTGCTSTQLACLVRDLADAQSFEQMRAAGPNHHFTPNGTTTKFVVLRTLAEYVRPDLEIRPATEEQCRSRPLASRLGAWERVYSGPTGWNDAVALAAAAKDR